jgi:UV excision repair protein RAD23
MTDLKVIIQNLKNDRFELTIQSSDTVDVVKGKIEARLQSEPPAQHMAANEIRLIHTGQILENGSATMEEVKVLNEDLLVIMKARKKGRGRKKGGKAATPAPAPAPVPVPVPAAPSPSPTETAASTEAAPATPSETAAPASTEVKASETSSNDVNAAASAMAIGNEQQEVIATLMAMGDYSMDQVRTALRCAWGNPDQAAEYLFTGIPPHVLAQHQNPGPAPPQPSEPMQQDDGSDGGDGGMPDGAAMAQAMQQNPQMMQMMLQAMAQQEGGQEMIQKLSQNPQMMMQLLSMMGGMGRGGPPQGGLPPQAQSGGQQAGVTTVSLDAGERQSIQNLQALAPGISQDDAVRAFIVCERNETLAANYLLDSLFNN